MFQTKRTFIFPDIKLSGLIDENPALLLMLEHFGHHPWVQDMTVKELCASQHYPEEVFLCIANFYNGFIQPKPAKNGEAGLLLITRFLFNSHRYYKEEKYPEIRSLIRELMSANKAAETKLVEHFFDEYFSEVTEHLDYEDKVVFPYIQSLIQPEPTISISKSVFSVEEYQDHHSDIASKLEDLKNLLIKHIPVHNDQVARRRLLMSLYELEYDLYIHTQIEERILIPMVKDLENKHGA